jgi:GNAT superfamily N-acetyltransferase
MLIRRITAAEGAAFFDLRRDAIRAGCAGHYGAAQIAAWTDPATDGSLQSPLSECFYLGLIDRAVVASGMLHAATGEIDAIFVAPSYFGRGLGRAMMMHLFAVAAEHRLTALELHATLNAAPFYRSLRFEGERIVTVRSPRGIDIEAVPMTRSLVGNSGFRAASTFAPRRDQ